MNDEKDMTFEAALMRLEEIVRALETGSAPLDASLAMFEEGVSLVKKCGEKLDFAEQRVKILISGQNGAEGYDEQNFG